MRKKKKNKNNQDAIDDWTDKNKSANRGGWDELFVKLLVEYTTTVCSIYYYSVFHKSFPSLRTPYISNAEAILSKKILAESLSQL
jgi:hypothetical protein